jgi:tRNA(fMet)-specific endonuclease VapC
MILYDTDICIELLRGNPSVISRHNQSEGYVSISFMTVGELYYGAHKSNYSITNIGRVDQFVKSVIVHQTNHIIMMKFGQLKAELSKLGRILPDADILIAATALIRCNRLITGNTAHFDRFFDLRVENWIK